MCALTVSSLSLTHSLDTEFLGRPTTASGSAAQRRWFGRSGSISPVFNEPRDDGAAPPSRRLPALPPVGEGAGVDPEADGQGLLGEAVGPAVVEEPLGERPGLLGGS